MQPVDGPKIDFGDDARLVALLEEREELNRRMKDDQRRWDEIKTKLAACLGTATYGRIGTWEVFWAETLYHERHVPEQRRRSLWARRVGNGSRVSPTKQRRLTRPGWSTGHGYADPDPGRSA
jgi:hypothetical protein